MRVNQLQIYRLAEVMILATFSMMQEVRRWEPHLARRIAIAESSKPTTRIMDDLTILRKKIS